MRRSFTAGGRLYDLVGGQPPSSREPSTLRTASVLSQPQGDSCKPRRRLDRAHIDDQITTGIVICLVP